MGIELSKESISYPNYSYMTDLIYTNVEGALSDWGGWKLLHLLIDNAKNSLLIAHCLVWYA